MGQRGGVAGAEMVFVSSGYSASEVKSGFSCLYRVFRHEAFFRRRWRSGSVLRFCETLLAEFQDFFV